MARKLFVVLIFLLYSCASNEKKRKTLMKYLWKDNSKEYTGYDVLVFDTVQSSDTGYFVVDKNMSVTKANKLIGTITTVSNRELTIQTPDNKKFNYVSIYDR